MYRLQQNQTNFVFPPIVQMSSGICEKITSYCIRNVCWLRIHYNSIFVYLDKANLTFCLYLFLYKKKKLKKRLMIEWYEKHIVLADIKLLIALSNKLSPSRNTAAAASTEPTLIKGRPICEDFSVYRYLSKLFGVPRTYSQSVETLHLYFVAYIVFI